MLGLLVIFLLFLALQLFQNHFHSHAGMIRLFYFLSGEGTTFHQFACQHHDSRNKSTSDTRIRKKRIAEMTVLSSKIFERKIPLVQEQIR